MLRNFFQPVVDAIRNAGFTGIVWVPGTGWQSNYVNYKSFPIKDATNNFGYAVHCYPGWYGTDSETGLQPKIMAKNFLAKVPVVKNKTGVQRSLVQDITMNMALGCLPTMALGVRQRPLDLVMLGSMFTTFSATSV